MTNLENLLSSDRETGFNKCVQFQITTNSTVTYNIHSGEFCLTASHPYYEMKWCTVLTRIVTIFFRLFFLLFIFLIFGFFLFFRWRNGNVWRRRGAITLPFRRIDANLRIATKKDSSDTTIFLFYSRCRSQINSIWRINGGCCDENRICSFQCVLGASRTIKIVRLSMLGVTDTWCMLREKRVSFTVERIRLKTEISHGAERYFLGQS